MRVDVSADVATTGHSDAAAEAFTLHLAAFDRAMLRLLRRFTREAVSAFLAHHPVVGAAAPKPDWGLPIPATLLDQQAAQAALEDESKTHRDRGATTAGQLMGSSLAIRLDVTNALLAGVIASQKGMHIVTAPEDLVSTLMTSLQASYDAGLSIPKAAREMRKAGYAHSQGYAERIARTELIGAVNEASLAMVRGATTLQYKVWVATMDDRTRDSHAELDGSTIPVDEVFDNGCSFPGDPDGDPDEVVNCRCTLGYADEPNVNTIAGGARMSSTDTTTTDDAADEVTVGASWAGPLAQEGVDTGDGRRIEPGALKWRQLPLTLMGQKTTPEWGGHADAQVSGRIDTITRNGENMDGTGVFDAGEWGSDIERLVREGMLNGVSVDLAINEAEVIPDPDIEDPDEAWWMGTLNILDGTILGATVVPFPAFENAKIAIVAGGAMRLHQFRTQVIDGATKRVCSFFMPFTKDMLGEPAPAAERELHPAIQDALDDALDAGMLAARQALKDALREANW